MTPTPVSSLSQEPEPTPSRLPPILLQQQQSAPTPIDSIRLKKNRDSTLTMGGMTADSACNTLAMSPCNHPTKMTVADCEKCRLHELSERRRREEKKKRKEKKKKKKQEKMKKDKVEEEEKAKQDGKEKAEEKPSPDRKAANDEEMKTAAPLPVSTDGSKRKLPDYSKSREGFKASRKDLKLEFNKIRDDLVMPETGEKKTTEQTEQTERTEEPKKEEEKKYEGIDGIEPEQQKKTTQSVTEDVMVLVKTKSVDQTGGISEGCI